LSFFDEGDEPRTAVEPPPPPVRRRSPSSPPPRRRGAPVDARTAFQRRAGALAIVAVVIVIAYFVFRAYEASANTQALKDYDAEVASLVEGEQTQVSQPVFASLAAAPGTTGSALTSLQSALEQDAVTARIDAQTAAGWSVPSAVGSAQRDLLLVLDMRYEALGKVQAYIEAALNQGSITAIKDITGAMQMLFASDVTYATEVVPLIREALVKDGIPVGAGGVSLPPTTPFLPNQSWTIAGYVAGRILGQTPTQLGGSLGSGTHGHRIISISIGSTTLSGSAVQQVAYTNPLNVSVAFVNDGSNDEFGVITKVSIGSAEVAAVANTRETRETVPGNDVTVVVPFTQSIKLNTPLYVTATVERVQGENNTGNNTLTYIVEFTKS